MTLKPDKPELDAQAKLSAAPVLGLPFNLMRWIEEHRHLLKPPVGNQVIWQDREFMIMVVGGPNSRKDYHVNQGEEFFYQLEGQMTLKVIDQGKPRDLLLQAGDIYLLPSGVPHSPRRPANSVGLVVERQRRPDEIDGFEWYCESCGELLYRTQVQVHDIVSQLPPVFESFYSHPDLTRCQTCGMVARQEGHS